LLDSHVEYAPPPGWGKPQAVNQRRSIRSRLPALLRIKIGCRDGITAACLVAIFIIISAWYISSRNATPSALTMLEMPHNQHGQVSIEHTGKVQISPEPESAHIPVNPHWRANFTLYTQQSVRMELAQNGRIAVVHNIMDGARDVCFAEPPNDDTLIVSIPESGLQAKMAFAITGCNAGDALLRVWAEQELLAEYPIRVE